MQQRQRFGRYETLFRIAGGGMAEVYAARIIGEGGFERVVALKRMLPTLAEDDRFVTMFLDEGRVAANIQSPHVVQTTDMGRAEDDSLYLVMEMVVGVPLSRLIREVLKAGRHMEPDMALELIAQAALGLHDAHEATTPLGEPLGIIHRDVSPQNILVDKAGRVRITDFGVARALQRSSHTQTGEVKGKMAYFAPEQAVGGDLDRRLDIFALGVVAWEALCGRRLFKSENPLQTLQKITQLPIPTVREHRPTIGEEISAVIAKALRRDPNERYATAAEFAHALRGVATRRVPGPELGAYVSTYGGEALQKIERGLQLAFTGDAESDGIVGSGPILSEADAPPTAVERTPLSTSQVILTQSTAGAVAAPAGDSKWWKVGFFVLLLTVVAAAGGAVLAMQNGDAPEATPTTAAEPNSAPAPVIPVPSQGNRPETTVAPTPAVEATPEATPEPEDSGEVEPASVAASPMRRRPNRGSRPATMLRVPRELEQSTPSETAAVAPMETTPMIAPRMHAPRMAAPAMEATPSAMETTTSETSTSRMSGVLLEWQ